jgi:hypothetical protein
LLGRPRECAASLPKAMLEFVYKWVVKIL